MGILKSKAYMLSLMALAMDGSFSSNFGGQFMKGKKDLTPEEFERLKALNEQKRKELLLKKGMKEWDINGIKILALNRKNAERKVANILRDL